MRTRDTEPDLDTDDLLAAERTIVPYPNDVRQRILAKARTAPLSIAVATEMGRSRWSALRLGFAALVILCIGSGAAAALQILRRAVPNNVPANGRHAAASLSYRAQAPLPYHAQASIADARTVESVAMPDGASMETRTDTEGYRRELEVLDRARRALAHSDFAAVLATADEHERRFPSGRLAEERDALRVRALFGQHRDRDARRAADAFRKAFPNSAFLRGL
jgi:hypothetical protein